MNMYHFKYTSTFVGEVVLPKFKSIESECEQDATRILKESESRWVAGIQLINLTKDI